MTQHEDGDQVEMWDVVDGDGRPTGRTTRRDSYELGPGEYHVVVGACVVAPGPRILVTRRSPEKTYPGKWEFPAGSAVAGDSSLEAARRELVEETGIDVPSEALTLIATVQEHPRRFDVYAVRLDEMPEVVPQPGEVDAFEWVSPDDVFVEPRRVDFAPPWHRRLDAMGEQLRRFVGLPAAEG